MKATFRTGKDMHEVSYDVVDSKTVDGTTYYRCQNGEDELVAIKLHGTYYNCGDKTVEEIF